MTQGIDIVIDPIESSKRIEELLASLADSDFLHDVSTIRRAIYRFADTKDRAGMKMLASTLGLEELMEQVLAESDEIQ